MASDLVKYAFVAGEISETFWSRSDLEKFDLAVAQATNWFVNYQGGLSTRPGLKFLDHVKADDKPTKFGKFKFSPDVAGTYVLVFGDLYVRFMQAGSYVLETEQSVTSVSKANPGVVTKVGHTYSDGDWVKFDDLVGMPELAGRSFIVANSTANTFELTDYAGNDVDTTGYATFTSGNMARVYTVTTPYAAADLQLLRIHQSRSVLYLTHQDYATRTLTRVAHANWTLAEVSFSAAIAAPGTPTVDAGAGTAGVGFRVTAVNAEGQESLPSDYGFDATAVDYSSTAGSAKVTWTASPDAVLYRVYRTNIIPVGSQVSRAMQVGFVGFAYGTEFIDNNIIPDFVITPPIHYDPFADGAFEYVEVTAGGTGYAATDTISVTTSTGTGAILRPVVNSSGVIVAVIIENGGKDYDVADTLSVTTAGGSGATFDFTLTAASGNNPGTSSVFQQRKIYAATENQPLSIFASKPRDYENMDSSQIIQQDDSYEFDVEAEEVAPIRHMLATRSGLVLVSQAGIWQLTGGQGNAVTPTNALADPQSYTGCSILPPLPIDVDLLYQEGKGSTVRLLSYNDYTKVFAGQDLSILSNHLTSPDYPIEYWDYASDPFKLVHMVITNGRMPLLTLVKEQNIYGWTVAETRGLFKDVIVMQEDRVDVVYVCVQRLINGRYTRTLEQFVRRNFTDVEDAWCVDSGVTNTPTYPSGTLTASAASGDTVTFTASGATPFASGDVGKVIRMGGGKAIITSFTSSSVVVGQLMRPITNVIPQTGDDPIPLPALEGEWTMDEPTTSFTGLWHLEGETVKVLSDGNVEADAVVSNGGITLPNSATRVIVGLGFQCVLRTLPPVAPDVLIEGKRKRVVAVKARLHHSRGLKAGSKLTNLVAMKERSDEPYNEPTRLQNGVKRLTVPSTFEYEGQFYIVQDDPLPATVLGLIPEFDVGDRQNR